MANIGREGAGNIVAVRERWLSRRAVSLHLAVFVFVPGCAVAAWWQITRAADGNQLSYLYSVMWPVFGILGVYFWWMLIHTDYETVGFEGHAATAGRGGRGPGVAISLDVSDTRPERCTVSAEEDPELAAYNARLAELAAQGPRPGATARRSWSGGTQ